VAKSKSLDLLRRIFLEDWETGERSRVVLLDAEEGATHFDLYTQSREQRQEGIAMRYRIHASECDAPPKGEEG
jgi:hypothetical protein